MKPEYSAWIRVYEERCGGPEATLGRCREAAEEMQRIFPELRIVSGHVECPAPWGRRGHWWCETSDDQIVDPTAGQFTAGIFDYDPYVEGQPVRIGCCANCGEAIWGDGTSGPPTVCSEECHAAFARYLNAEVGR